MKYSRIKIMKRKPGRIDWQDCLRPYAEYQAALFRSMRDLSVHELKKFIVACEMTSETNIWWVTYQAAPLIKDFAMAVLSEKEHKS